jgi:hypothetical protein
MVYVAGALANLGTEETIAAPATPTPTPVRDTDQEGYRRWYPSLNLSYEFYDSDFYALFGLGLRLAERTGLVVKISAPSFGYEEVTYSGGISRFKGRKYTNFLLGFDDYAGILFIIERGLPLSRRLFIIPGIGVSTGELDIRASVGLSLGL